MRDDNIEHRQCKTVPFTVKGDLKSVLRALGLPDGMEADEAKDIFCGDAVCVRVATGEPCVITTWECVKGDGPAYYTVNARPVRMVSKPATPIDQWVVVGTTTIDGSLDHVARLLTTSFEEAWPVVDAFLRDEDGPWLVGGRWLRAHGGSVYNGLAVIRCDIVRRQSEIDAEKKAREQAILDGLMRVHMSNHECPECGPHGNRGEVLLASSWAKCTTCAGGKPGDLWGEVKVRGPATAQEALSSALIAEGASSEVAQAGVRAFLDALAKPPSFPTLATAENLMRFEIASGILAPDGRSFMDARREALAAQHGQGFKVPTRRAALDDLRRILCEPPADVSVEEYRRIIFGEQVS